MRSWLFGLLTLFALALGSSAAPAQDEGTLNPKPLPPLANPADPKLPAKQVFGRALTPVEAQARSIGFYSRGCLAGAKALPVDGESWQVVRLSRNRMWGNPAMIAFLERFSRKAKAKGVWNGILFNLGKSFISPTTVLPAFLSQLNASSSLIGLRPVR